MVGEPVEPRPDNLLNPKPNLVKRIIIDCHPELDSGSVQPVLIFFVLVKKYMEEVNEKVTNIRTCA